MPSDIIKEDEVIEDISTHYRAIPKENARFILARYLIVGYLILIVVLFVLRVINPTLDLEAPFSLLEKIGYVIATITGFYFTKAN